MIEKKSFQNYLLSVGIGVLSFLMMNSIILSEILSSIAPMALVRLMTFFALQLCLSPLIIWSLTKPKYDTWIAFLSCLGMSLIFLGIKGFLHSLIFLCFPVMILLFCFQREKYYKNLGWVFAFLSCAGCLFLLYFHYANPFMSDVSLPDELRKFQDANPLFFQNEKARDIFNHIMVFFPSLLFVSWILMFCFNLWFSKKIIFWSNDEKINTIEIDHFISIKNIQIPLLFPLIPLFLGLILLIPSVENYSIFQNFFIILMFPLVSQGLSMIHRVIGNMNSPKFKLTVFYFFTILSSWALVFIAILGLVEHFIIFYLMKSSDTCR